MALARKVDFRGAEAIYRAEAEYLLSAERKQQFAAIYLELADACFHPAKEDQAPDFARALEFYGKALEAGPAPAQREEVELLVAQCHEKLGQLAEAAKLYAEFSAAHAGRPLDVEARMRLGQCQLGQQRFKEARRTWQDLLAKYPDAPSPSIAEAAFLLSRTWHIPAPTNDEELSLGLAALQNFLERFPKHKRAGEASLDIARSYLARGHFDDAVRALTGFLKDQRYQACKEMADARILLGESYVAQRKFPEALGCWQEFLLHYPVHESTSSVQRSLVDTEFLWGLDRWEAKDYVQAAQALERVHPPLSARPAGKGDPAVLRTNRASRAALGGGDRPVAAVDRQAPALRGGGPGPAADRGHARRGPGADRGGPGSVPQGGRGKQRAGGPPGRRPAHEQEHERVHGAGVPLGPDAAAEAGHAEHRVGHGPRL